MLQPIKVIDSHTGGEPTRIIIDGGPDLGSGSFAQRLENFRDNFDDIRKAVINEPRGTDVLVGGLLCRPTQPNFAAGVIFFNNIGYLGMCGHGTIGLMVTLKQLGQIQKGKHQIETSVGPVVAELGDHGRVSVENVPSYRLHTDVSIEVPNYGTVIGDVAWGGNWFFLVKETTETLVIENVDRLTDVTLRIRKTLDENGISGSDGPIDHIELFSAPNDPENDSRNFVLCPGGAYDRSPCGTGLSAKLACLAADGQLAPGEIWRQESIVGSVFTGAYETRPDSNAIVPTIEGSAFICGETTLNFDPNDPFYLGIPK